jgi:hypothetical protein
MTAHKDVLALVKATEFMTLLTLVEMANIGNSMIEFLNT